MWLVIGILLSILYQNKIYYENKVNVTTRAKLQLKDLRISYKGLYKLIKIFI